MRELTRCCPAPAPFNVSGGGGGGGGGGGWRRCCGTNYLNYLNLSTDRSFLSFTDPYPPAKTPPKGRGLVNIAVLSLGADGGCAGPNPPASPAAKAERIIAYLNRAGERGTDLAVLPENAFGRPGEKPACFMAAEPVSGPTVSAIRAIAKRYGMNVVLPIHEARGGAQ